MPRWFADNSLTIGRTPLVKLNRVTDGASATILAKIEGRNPAYSVKCRLGAAMIWDAEKKELLVREESSSSRQAAIPELRESRYTSRLLRAPVTSNNLLCSSEAIDGRGDDATSVSRAFADRNDARH